MLGCPAQSALDDIPLAQSRFSVLDSWRGIAATAVALFHLQAASHIYGLHFLRNSYLFVDFFFVLSGFAIAHAYGHRLHSWPAFFEFIIRRSGRVWPLHFAVLVAFVAVESVKYVLTSSGEQAGLAAFDPQGHTAMSALPIHVFLLHALGLSDKLTWNEPSWSISAEFWMYVVFGLVCLFAGGWKSRVLAALGLAGAYTVAASSTTGMDVTFDLGFARCLFGFAIGTLVYDLYRNLPADRRTLPMASLLEWGALIGVVWFVSVAGRSDLSIAAPLVFAMPVLIFSLEAGVISRALSHRIFQRLGDWSYSIYMVHGLIAFSLALGVSWIQRRTGVTLWQEVTIDGVPGRLISANPYALDLLFAAYLALVLVLARFTYRWIEQPGRAAFARMASRVSGQAITIASPSRPA